METWQILLQVFLVIILFNWYYTHRENTFSAFFPGFDLSPRMTMNRKCIMKILFESPLAVSSLFYLL